MARLPVQGTEKNPVILLEAETHAGASEDPRVRIYGGRVTAQKGVDRVAVTKTRVEVVKKGVARTSVTFQYSLEPRLPASEYGFQVHYMCGGDPKVSAQSFVVKAGPDAEHLEERGRFKVTNPILSGWKMQWLKGDKPLTLKAGDALLEIHNEGQAHDAKVFDAFLLVPVVLTNAKPTEAPKKEVKKPAPAPKKPAPEPKPRAAVPLPVQGTEKHPVVLLEAEPHDGTAKDPTVRVRGGKVIHHEGADSLNVERHQVVLAKKGNGRTRLTIRYELAGDIPANNYAFQTRYMCGGEPRVSGQTVTVQAGPDAEHLEERAKFTVTNPTAWRMQWVKGPKPFALRAEDRVLDITVEGVAHAVPGSVGAFPSSFSCSLTSSNTFTTNSI